ncbi:MAG: glutathione S-transferase [Bacteroidetes bacterium]|nr:MAG: glutathione S-transferase [Bacteroidota bacterium]
MSSDTINIDRLIHAPVNKVWDAWTDADLVLYWFGSDPKGKGIKANLDVRPGGKFEITFRNSDGTEFTCSGSYVEVQKFNKLTFTWEWKNEPGIESFVTLIFTPANQFTRMQFEHAHVGDKSAHDYAIGWRSTFDKLDRLLSPESGDNN